MKVFVFSTHPLWASHYETELEIIENHIKSNDEVFHFTCYGVLKSCDVNLKHDFGTCFRCSDVTNCGRKIWFNRRRIILAEHTIGEFDLEKQPFAFC